MFSKKPASRLFSKYFQVKIFPNSAGFNRFAAVVGLKVDKSSVKRHFWKRVMLDSAAKQKNFSADFVIGALPELGKAGKKEAEKDLSEIFNKVK